MDRFIKILRIILIAFFVLWGIVWLSIRAYVLDHHGNERGLNKWIVELYKKPSEIKSWFDTSVKKPYQAVIIEDEKGIYEIGKMSQINQLNDSTYLLYYKYLNESKGEILLQNIKTGEIERNWKIPLNLLMKDLDSIKLVLQKYSREGKAPIELYKVIAKKSSGIAVKSPIFFPDGSIIFHTGHLGHLYKLDKDSKLLWKSKKLVHHSIEVDENNNIWTCSISFDNEMAKRFKYRDDAILYMDQSGNELYFKSLTEIFKENNLFEECIESTTVYKGKFGIDPFHLNDVEPVKKDGLFWKKNDVFLSIRSKSLVLLYRPISGLIVWKKQGPWISQHDVDIVNDSNISIFNNNTSYFNNKINTSSNIVFFNFKSKKATSFANNIFNSETEGRLSNLENGQFLIEETNKAIYFVIDSIGQVVVKFYVPYSGEINRAQYPSWSRVYIHENNGFSLK